MNYIWVAIFVLLFGRDAVLLDRKLGDDSVSRRSIAWTAVIILIDIAAIAVNVAIL